MTSPTSLSTVLSCLEEHQAQSISTIDVRKATSLTDTMVVCTSTSTRHALAVKNHLVEALKKQHPSHLPPRVEGEHASDWVLVDCGDVIVHIMLAEARNYYEIEKLWQGLVQAHS